MSIDPSRMQEDLAAAAAATYRRIEHDFDRVSPPLKPLLRYLRHHLFDPDLRLEQWMRACGVSSNVLPTRFSAEIGLPPNTYLWDCRLETGTRLLRDTNLTVTEIGEAVGYFGRTAFSRAFEKWWGVRPTLFRRRLRRVQERTGPIPDRFLSPAWLSRLFAGKLDPAEARMLHACLRAIYEQSAPVGRRAEAEGTEQAIARYIWEAIRTRPFREQHDLVRTQLGLKTPALFKLLEEKSREEGRIDRRRGVELAELALASLEALPPPPDRNLFVHGRVWLANAHRLALDYAGSEWNFALAEVELAALGVRADPLVQAAFSFYRAALQWFQRRYAEGLQLVHRAIALYRDAQEEIGLARALLLRAGICQDMQDLEPTLPDLEEAISLLGGLDEHYLLISASTHLATSHIRLGNFALAEQAIGEAEALNRHLGNSLLHHQILWLSAQVHEGLGNTGSAEKLLHRARDGMIALEERGHAAIISLELAALCTRLGRSAEVVEHVVPAIAILDGFAVHREALVALRLLHTAVAAQAVSSALVDQFRRTLQDLRHAEPFQH